MNIVNSWKLYIPRSIGSGNAKVDVVKPIIAGPNSCCSGTYIVCGPFKNELQNCEFVGCTHIKEEKCGIKDAVYNNKISKDRYERFCKIYN